MGSGCSLPGSLLLPAHYLVLCSHIPQVPLLPLGSGNGALTGVTDSIVGSLPLAASAPVTHPSSVWVGYPGPPLNIVHLPVVPAGSKTVMEPFALSPPW